VAVGSRAWVAATGGTLGLGARVRFAREAVGIEVAALPGRLRRRVSRGADVVLDPWRSVPDSPLAREIAGLAEVVVPEPLLGHCLRTWLWGSLLARSGYDEERLYVSALLHDIGLTAEYGPRVGDGAGCFAVHGAERARRILVERGADGGFAAKVADAIALHMNNRVSVEEGIEAHLLHAGAHLDVVGRRARELPEDVLLAGVTRFPRAGFADCFIDLMRQEARRRPHSRAGVLWRLGMRPMIARTSFPVPS
jgi:hypothetical protein